MSEWPEDGPPVVWRRPIGGGYSAVVAVGERVYTMDADDDDEAVLCLDAATGATLWRVPVGPFVQRELDDGGPRSTPTVAGDLVVAVSSSARLVALATADGELRWQRDLTEWGPVPRYGYATSPLVDGGLVVVEAGKPEAGPGILAFDLKSGELAWGALEGPTGYASPVAAEIGGVRQVVVSRGREVAGIGLDGTLLWRHETEPRAAIPTPLFLPPDRIFVSTADDASGGQMLRVIREGDGFRVEELWSQRLMRNHFNTSVAVGGHLYGFDNGTLRCLDAATGERRWAKRGFGKGSLVAAGDLLLVLGDAGMVATVRADPAAYREGGRLQVTAGGRAWTEPSLADGRLYVRDFDEIVSLDLRVAREEPPG